MNPTSKIVLVLALSGCATAPAAQHTATPSQPTENLSIPMDLRDDIARSSAVGRQLHMLDKVSAIATDALFDRFPNARDSDVVGYLPLQEADTNQAPTDSFLVSFFTDDTLPRIVYEVRVRPGMRPETQQFEPPKEAMPSIASLIRARQAAITAMPATDQPINPLVVPADSHEEALVYLLAGTAKPNTAVLGKHFRASVSILDASVTAMTPLSKTALELATRTPDGEIPEALIVTHLVTDYPLETHVFASLLNQIPIYVGTSRGMWLVDGERISYKGEFQEREAPPDSTQE